MDAIDNSSVNLNRLRELIQMDPKVSHDDKKDLIDILYQPDALAIILGGAAGAALTKSILTFTNLDKASQTLLSVAGFGIGSILVKTLGQDQSHLVNYEAGKGYRVNTK